MSDRTVLLALGGIFALAALYLLMLAVELVRDERARRRRARARPGYITSSPRSPNQHR